MTIIWASGIELGSLDMIPDFRKSPSNVFANDVYPHTGTYCLEIGNFQTTGYINIEITSMETDLYISVWAYPGVAGYVSENTMKIGVVSWNGSEWQTDLGIEFDQGYWNAFVDGVEVATGSIRVVNAYHHISIHLKTDSTLTIETKIDGISDIHYADSPIGGQLSFITFLMVASGGGQGFYFDDIAIGSGGWLGDIRIEAIIPDSDTATAQWTPSTGSDNYAMVDEIPPNDSDFVYTETNSDRDVYTLSDWIGLHKIPVAIVQWLRAWKGSADSQDIKMITVSGATTVLSTPILVTSSPKMYKQILERDPDGDIPWTESSINDLKIGQEAEI